MSSTTDTTAQTAQAAEAWVRIGSPVGVSVSGGHSDFGDEPHLFGSPGEGSVTFYARNGMIRAVVRGRTYLDDLAGHSARTVIHYEKSTGANIAEEVGGEVSSPSGGLHMTGEWSRQGADPKLTQVRIRTQLKTAGGSYTTTKQKVVRLSDV